MEVCPFDPEAPEAMADLMCGHTRSPRTEMGLADASLVWLAADIGVTRVMTMDRCDFSRHRLPDGREFEIL